MSHSACNGVQPSILAACSSSRGSVSKKPFIIHVAKGTPTDTLAITSPATVSVRCSVVNMTKNGMTMRLPGSIFDSSSVAPATRCAGVWKRDRL